MHTRSIEIVEWLRERVTAASARGLVVGLTGTIESAVAARLCQMATPDCVRGVILPCHDHPQREGDARLAADHFRIPTVLVDLAPIFDRLAAELVAAVPVTGSLARQADAIDEVRQPAALTSVTPRLRMTCLYFVADALQYLVAGSASRSELIMGSFTKYGETGADVLPLGDLLMSDVRGLARALEIPEPLLHTPSVRHRWLPHGEDEEPGFTAAQLERYLEHGPEAVAPALALRIERLVRQNAHKRAMAPTPSSDSEGLEPY